MIAVSKGGETEEVLALLPYLAHREVPVIAIVGNLRSTLARQAAVALEASVEREAGRYDLVPTASVAVALAVADALALTVMEVKGVTPEGFAANHPSGQLGRRLDAARRATSCSPAISARPSARPPRCSTSSARSAAAARASCCASTTRTACWGSSPTATCAARSRRRPIG